MIRALLLGVLFLLIARAFWSFVDGIMEAAGATSRRRDASAKNAAVKLVRDPVCGTFIPPREALSATTREGTYYFCSEKCRAKFPH